LSVPGETGGAASTFRFAQSVKAILVRWAFSVHLALGGWVFFF
jgi:hypothetical protein